MTKTSSQSILTHRFKVIFKRGLFQILEQSLLLGGGVGGERAVFVGSQALASGVIQPRPTARIVGVDVFKAWETLIVIDKDEFQQRLMMMNGKEFGRGSEPALD